jgi:riboflavin biosynthesis pyrimidine reductase
MSNLRVLLRGVDPSAVILQMPSEENGQFERQRTTKEVAVGRLALTYARKRLQKIRHDAVFVGSARPFADDLMLMVVWPARKRPPAPAVNDQNLRGLLKRLKLPTDDWIIVNIERMET